MQGILISNETEPAPALPTSYRLLTTASPHAASFYEVLLPNGNNNLPSQGVQISH